MGQPEVLLPLLRMTLLRMKPPADLGVESVDEVGVEAVGDLEESPHDA